MEIKFSIQLTSAVRRKENFVLVTMNPEAIGTSELNIVDGWKNVRSDNLA